MFDVQSEACHFLQSSSSAEKREVHVTIRYSPLRGRAISLTAIDVKAQGDREARVCLQDANIRWDGLTLG